MRRLLSGIVPDLAELAPSLPATLVVAVKKALARDPGERFQSADEFLAALEQSMPIAPAREVAAYLLERAGPDLEAQRRRLHLCLSGFELERLSPHVELQPTQSEVPRTRTDPDAAPKTVGPGKFLPRDTIADDKLQEIALNVPEPQRESVSRHPGVAFYAPPTASTLASAGIEPLAVFPDTRSGVSGAGGVANAEAAIVSTTSRRGLVIGAAVALFVAGGFAAWTRADVAKEPEPAARSSASSSLAPPAPAAPILTVAHQASTGALSRPADADVAPTIVRAPPSAPPAYTSKPPSPAGSMRPSVPRDDLHKNPYE